MDGNLIAQFAGLIVILILVAMGILAFFVPLMVLSISPRSSRG